MSATRDEEQQQVERVIAETDRRIASLEQQVSDVAADIVDIRTHFWDDVTVNFDAPEEAMETYASMKQQAEVLSERERTHQHASKQLKTLKRLRRSPYFGRIDFQEEDQSHAETLYVGIASLLDEHEDHFLIYDWRAPVSSLYYDFSPGPAHYETPGGTISGVMELKRQFMIADGVIQSMFDTDVTIGDELLQDVLGKQASTQMKSIVATIQKEQNRLIRNERGRVLVVQGAAGSGKTSAALQRVAYLLYRFRTTLRADQIVLFSPNPLFNSYVSTVLPELGEENMQQATYQEYLEHRLGGRFLLEDPFSQLEYVHTAMRESGYEARMAGIRFKSSFPFIHMIERYVERLRTSGMHFSDIRFRGRVLISGEQIKERFYALDSSLAIPNRIGLLTDMLLADLKACAARERKKPWVEEEVQLLDKDAFAKVYQQLRRKKRLSGDTFDDFDMEQKLLANMVVADAFKPLRQQVKQASFVDVQAIYRQLFDDSGLVSELGHAIELPDQWEEMCQQTVMKLDQGELSYEDATPYLYLQEQLEGFQTNTAVRHVLIDEAQDYSAFQFAFIKRLFPYSKLTVLGDLNQAIYAHADAADFGPLAVLYGEAQTETIMLTRSYRSTRQIVEFTRHLLAGAPLIVPFNRNGPLPTITKTASPVELAVLIKERIRSLEAVGHRSIAVICKTAKECEDAYTALKEELPLRLIDKETVSFEPGTLVIPAYLAKGVEFDAVVLYNSSSAQYGRESERKLLYTACTRAMHELHVYSLGDFSPFFASAPPETYVAENM
ncbi:MAG: RNA polymerase recycling motor HelD [Clostridia bacterium]